MRAEGDDRIPVSLSSDTPVRRWFGFEVLEHTAEAVNMERAARGLSLLWNHDTDVVTGRVTDITIRGDGKLGGYLKFGRGARALEARQDVEDGTVTDISIGYRIDEWVEEQKDGVSTYRAKRWTPMEVSLVTVPADHTVGVGRSAERAAHPAVNEARNAPPEGKEKVQMAEVQTPAPAERTGSNEVRNEDAKVIAAWGKSLGMADVAATAITEGRSIEEFRVMAEEAATRKAAAQQPTGHVDLSPKDERAYSPANAIRMIVEGTWHSKGSLEKEVSDAVAKRTGKDVGGNHFYIPLNVRASVTGGIVGTASLGGNAVDTLQGPMIELLRNRVVLARAGARFLTGLTGPVKFPRQITANTAGWRTENPSSAQTLTALTLDTVTLAPKSIDAHTSFSRELAFQMSPDAQQFITDDILRVIAIAIDASGISGAGTNEPTGILNNSSVGAGTALGTHGGAPTFASVIELETSVANANADVGRMSYLVNSKTRGKLKQTLKLSTATAPGYIWEGANDPGTINGYNAFVSNQVPSNLTKGTSTTICSSIIFGNFDDLLIAEFGGAVDVLVDPYSFATQGMIALHAYAFADVAVRHGASFYTVDDVLT